MNNWIEISAPNLTANFHTLQVAAGSATEILAVVKANAYGHGASVCAPILVRASARWLGVTNATEGAAIRQTLSWEGLDANILIMSGFLPEDVPLITSHDLIPVVWTLDHIASLAGTSTRIHVEVDTGMGRQGVVPGRPLDALFGAIRSSSLTLDGLFTHFCCTELAQSEQTALQQRRFEPAVKAAESYNLRPRWLHAGNSSSLDNPTPFSGQASETWLATLAATVGARAMVRTGLALYGHALPIEGVAAARIRANLQPVMTWRAAVLATRTLAPGDTVGYNATFTATSEMRVALLGAGYADGLRRELSGRADLPGGWVMIGSDRCPILGRISMNLTVVDVTHLAEVPRGTFATLLGPGITADDHAALARTIPYEILCGIHPCG